MVTFARYVELAYEQLEQKGHAADLRGPGTQAANQQFMRELSAAYNANNHSEASVSAARQFLAENVGPP